MVPILAMLAVAALVDVSATTISSTMAMTTTPRSKAPCVMCPVGSLRPDVIATQPQDPPGTIDYTCQSAQNWLNAPGTTTTCADGQAYWRTTCCTPKNREFLAPHRTLTATLSTVTYTVTETMTTTTATLTTTTAVPTAPSCVMCLNEDLRETVIATQPQDPPGTLPYTCKDAQDWLNAPSTTATCATGRAYWKTTCCIQKPSQTTSPAPVVPVDIERVERVKTEIDSFIHSSDLDEVTFTDLIWHLERVFSVPIDATNKAKIKEYAIMIAGGKLRLDRKNSVCNHCR